MIGYWINSGDLATHRGGRMIAYHSHGPVEGRTVKLPGRDSRRSTMHVTNVRRQQREAKRALQAIFA
jgi:hypothetical protein